MEQTDDKRLFVFVWKARIRDQDNCYSGTFVGTRKGLNEVLAFYREGHPLVDRIEVKSYKMTPAQSFAVTCDTSPEARKSWELRRREMEDRSNAANNLARNEL